MISILEEVLENIQRDSSISFPGLGNWSINPPSSFTIFGRDIYMYGIIIAIGFILGILYCSNKSSKLGIKSDDVYDLMLFLIPLSIIGARTYFVVFEWDYFSQHPEKIFAIHEGGLALYGGIIFGFITIFVFCRVKKIKFLALLDLIVFGLLIGQILGRWGNFFNREAFGSETDCFIRMGLTTPAGKTVYVHPTFLYESLWNLICFIFLSIFLKKGKRQYDGQLILIYFFWYGIGRSMIEGLRIDSLYIGSSNIKVSQLLSLILAFTAFIILAINLFKNHSEKELFVNLSQDSDTSDTCSADEEYVAEPVESGTDVSPEASCIKNSITEDCEDGTVEAPETDFIEDSALETSLSTEKEDTANE